MTPYFTAERLAQIEEYVSSLEELDEAEPQPSAHDLGVRIPSTMMADAPKTRESKEEPVRTRTFLLKVNAAGRGYRVEVKPRPVDTASATRCFRAALKGEQFPWSHVVTTKQLYTLKAEIERKGGTLRGEALEAFEELVEMAREMDDAELTTMDSSESWIAVEDDGDLDDAAFAARAAYERVQDSELKELADADRARREEVRASAVESLEMGEDGAMWASEARAILRVTEKPILLVVNREHKRLTVKFADGRKKTERYSSLDELRVATRRVRAHFEGNGRRTRTWVPA